MLILEIAIASTPFCGQQHPHSLVEDLTSSFCVPCDLKDDGMQIEYFLPGCHIFLYCLKEKFD